MRVIVQWVSEEDIEWGIVLAPTDEIQLEVEFYLIDKL